jgi:hypothetical protein
MAHTDRVSHRLVGFAGLLFSFACSGSEPASPDSGAGIDPVTVSDGAAGSSSQDAAAAALDGPTNDTQRASISSSPDADPNAPIIDRTALSTKYSYDSQNRVTYALVGLVVTAHDPTGGDFTVAVDFSPWRRPDSAHIPSTAIQCAGKAWTGTASCTEYYDQAICTGCTGDVISSCVFGKATATVTAKNSYGTSTRTVTVPGSTTLACP